MVNVTQEAPSEQNDSAPQTGVAPFPPVVLAVLTGGAAATLGLASLYLLRDDLAFIGFAIAASILSLGAALWLLRRRNQSDA